jgi:hypothetical protein
MFLKTLIIKALCLLSFAVHTQTTIYLENFNNTTPPNLPTNWTTTHNSNIFVDNNVSSSGYAGASGGNNLLAQNCQPIGDNRSFTVSNISTTNASGLEVSFGHRRTGSFTPDVLFEWSSDGSNWNQISNITTGSTTWELIAFTLPVSAENQSSISFRWSYLTDNGGGCATAVPNYRIDDFKLTAMMVAPVELVHFKVDFWEEDVMIEWQTATEIQNDYFVLEHSRDGRYFVELGSVLGAGNSNQILDYDFLHNNPNSGINYYRLKQVDFDGSYAYSPIQSIMIKAQNQWNLRNNIADNRLIVEANTSMEAEVKAVIYDYSGHIIKVFDLSPHETTYTLPVQDFRDQRYILAIYYDGQISAFPFLKQS